MEPVYEKGGLESVCKTIENEIINQGKWISTDNLLNIYGEYIVGKKITEINWNSLSRSEI